MNSIDKKVTEEQQLLSELLNHQGWSVARQKLVDKILSLQNAFEIEHATPTTMLRDLQARKKATEILNDFLRELEGSPEVIGSITPNKKSYIVSNE